MGFLMQNIFINSTLFFFVSLCKIKLCDMSEEKVNKCGRPTKYKDEYNLQAEKMCKLGATDIELADFFNVCEDTIYEWKNVYVAFSESIKKGKDIFDTRNVENSLRTRAQGLTVTEERQTTRKLKLDDQNPDEIEGEIIDTTITKKELPPDTAAAIFWLKNRDSKRWKDKQDVEHSGEITSRIVDIAYSDINESNDS